MGHKKIHTAHTHANTNSATAAHATPSRATKMTVYSHTSNAAASVAQADRNDLYNMHLNTQIMYSYKNGQDTNLGTRHSPYTSLSPDYTTRFRREIAFRKLANSSIGIRVVRVQGHVYISHVKKGSRGWNIGLSPGDRIEQVNTMNMRDPTSLSAAEVAQLIFEPSQVDMTIVDNALPEEIVAAAEADFLENVQGRRRASVSSRLSEASRISRRSFSLRW
eukprot:comp7699_c0_seq1/m.3333 comp7699_c0_seq1/g.3333  ORF comp7699_c0_seq1/g.3333 comp7699_c0_seq1/m.3333 type:complete len:220 (-) comp7699_c0_seq1:436-1095(-)